MLLCPCIPKQSATVSNPYARKKSLTLEDVAKLTGVSKPMLGQIERGKSTPTITTLTKISTGLKVPLTSFLKPEEPEYTVASIQIENQIDEENGLMRVYNMFPYDPVRNMEMYYIEMDGGCKHESDKHMEGSEEYLVVLRGKVDLTIAGKKMTLRKQQAVRFHADLHHVYEKPLHRVLRRL